MEKKELNEKEINESSSDFEFVQIDESIHDKKFDTKPTTYLKDAIKRFFKNRSSVVAGAILFTLIAMAIIVPSTNKSDINAPNDLIKYLPPKWFSGDMGGFLDGTGKVENIVLDPETKQLPADSDYKEYAVIGDISTKESYANQLDRSVSKYGKGGAVTIENASTKNKEGHWDPSDGGIWSPIVNLGLTETDPISYTVNIDRNFVLDNKASGTTLKVNLSFVTTLDNKDYFIKLASFEDINAETAFVNETIDGEEAEIIKLENNDVAAKIKEDENFASSNSVDGRFAIVIEAPSTEADSVNKLFVRNVTCSSSSLISATWTDSTKMATGIDNATDGYFSRIADNTKISVYHSLVTYGSFRYDYYAAVFGEIEKEFTEADIEEYQKEGWMSYEWNPNKGSNLAPGEFTLTEEGEKYCPLRSVISQDSPYNPLNPDDPELSKRSVRGTYSLYRDLFKNNKIATCEMPKYFFGTDSHGYDFFKLVFSGLLTSLGLGLLSATINIFIGLIWGAISGYFGGWVDLLMERICEILGGMPWIVMMTLIVLLLGSNFWTFLLALCLTGWMGVASETRSQFYRYKRREYVLASRTLGASDARLIFKHILPNGIGTIITGAVLMIPSVIFTEANISYLLPAALSFSGGQSFGVTLSNVQGDLNQYPYLIVSASVVMALIMICFNLFGNGLRDAFNPSLKGADE
ncbi:MAG TPA: hypothetical protein DEF61_00485 [Firmicutes bacterium]|nr:hypothetical protein [Bacillota bacterium]